MSNDLKNIEMPLVTDFKVKGIIKMADKKTVIEMRSNSEVDARSESISRSRGAPTFFDVLKSMHVFRVIGNAAAVISFWCSVVAFLAKISAFGLPPVQLSGLFGALTITMIILFNGVQIVVLFDEYERKRK